MTDIDKMGERKMSHIAYRIYLSQYLCDLLKVFVTLYIQHGRLVVRTS